MSGAGGSDAARGIARGLHQVLMLALGDGASIRTLDAARDLAQVLSLRGLDRWLTALVPHMGSPWPAGLQPVIGRVRQAAAECGREGTVSALRTMDDELSLMAQAIERVPVDAAPSPPSLPPANREPAPAEPVSVPLSETLDGMALPRGSQELVNGVQLRPPVAGALRAALDWLIGDGAARPRPALACDGAALEIHIDGVAVSGIPPAAQVLASVGGHLGPSGERAGAWTVRVPVLAERELFLMLEQDELRLAVPWHAVARVRVVPTDTIEAMASRQGLAVLERLAAAPRRAAEQPVVVVALGLKRACLVADRLVWRMPAEPAEVPGDSPAPGIVRAVRSEDGDLYWVLEPAWLLRAVAAPALADPGTVRVTPARPAQPAPAARPEPSRPPAPIPFPAPLGRTPVRAEPEAVEPPPEPLRSLEPGDVSPIAAQGPEPPPVSSPPPVASPASATPASETAPPAERMRAALVAEDSITARIFLTRLLEQRGFAVHAVGTAAELDALLPNGPWALVCVDIELPDATGHEFIVEMARRTAAGGARLVVLVRDAEDEKVARAAGIGVTLRKPFEHPELDRALAGLGPARPRAGAGGDALPSGGTR